MRSITCSSIKVKLTHILLARTLPVRLIESTVILPMIGVPRLIVT